MSIFIFLFPKIFFSNKKKNFEEETNKYFYIFISKNKNNNCKIILSCVQAKMNKILYNRINISSKMIFMIK